LASPGRSYAEGPGLEPGNKNNKPAEFTIYAVTPDGRPKKTGGDLFDVHIEDPNNNLIHPEIRDNNDGTYDVKYQPTVPGNYNVDVIIRNKAKPLFYDHVKNSPVPVKIDAGPYAPNCIAYGPGLEPGNTDTEPAEFFIQARDINGNPIKEGNENFNVVIAGPKEKVPVKVEDLGDGTYKVTYQPKEPGPHVINVDLEGKLIKDAPFHVNIEAGGSAANTTMEDFKFVVKVRDRHNKPLNYGGEKVEVQVQGPSGSVPVKVTDNQNGTYGAHYTLTGKGQYNIPVLLKGKDVKGSPMNQTMS
jgi:filamin